VSDSSKKIEAETFPDRVEFHYQKSSAFRVIHVDGVHGSASPRGYIQAAFFSERRAIPKIEYRIVNADATLGDEIIDDRDQLAGYVRELEVMAVMDLEVAKSFRIWLDQKIALIEDRQAKAESDTPNE
jgi:uncharacterized protein YkvS